MKSLVKKRIGWCIPINALDSKEHDYSENEHFLKYAYAGVKEAFKNISEAIWVNEIDISNSSEIKFSDIFHESTALLVISKEALDESHPFVLQKALPSLFKFGYVELSKNNPSLLALHRPSPENKRINIEYVSDDVGGDKLVSGLLMSFAFSQSEVLRFFYLYQIIELLLERIFEHEQNKVIQELNTCHQDSNRVKDVLEKIQNNTSEKKRIELLIDKYCSMTDQLSSIRTSCNQFLTALGKEESSEFKVYFYSIRNFIFHQYRNFPEDGAKLLDAVIEDFLDLLPSLLAKFKK